MRNAERALPSGSCLSSCTVTYTRTDRYNTHERSCREGSRGHPKPRPWPGGPLCAPPYGRASQPCAPAPWAGEGSRCSAPRARSSAPWEGEALRVNQPGLHRRADVTHPAGSAACRASGLKRRAHSWLKSPPSPAGGKPRPALGPWYGRKGGGPEGPSAWSEGHRRGRAAWPEN